MFLRNSNHFYKTVITYLVLIITAVTLGCEVIDERSWVPKWGNANYKNLPDFNHFRSEELNKESILKVLIVPFSFENGPEKISETITDTYAAELRKTGMFRLATPLGKPAELIEAANVLWDRGFIDVDVLLDARKRYGIDALLFGKISNYKPYMPLVLGVKLTMISTMSGNALWGVDGEFASDQKDVVQLAKSYYKKYYNKDTSLYGWELVLISMKRYSRFVANMLVSTLMAED